MARVRAPRGCSDRVDLLIFEGHQSLEDKRERVHPLSYGVNALAFQEDDDSGPGDSRIR